MSNEAFLSSFVLDANSALTIATKYGPLKWVNHGEGLLLNYNGVDVVYFPKSFAEKGTTTGTLESYTYPSSGYGFSQGNIAWFGNGIFLHQPTWDYLKPATLDQSLINEINKQDANRSKKKFWTWDLTGQTYQTNFDIRDVPNFQDGYIIERSKFEELAKKSGGPGNPINFLSAYSPARIPSGMGIAPDGNLSYVGYTQGGGGYDRRSDLFYINNSPEAFLGRHDLQWYNCGSFGCSFDDFLGSTLGQLIILAARINPWFNLGYTLGNVAFNDGKIGDLALAVINLNMPTTGGTTPAGGTIFEIPQIASMGSKLAEFYTPYLGAEAAKAASFVTVNTGLNYLANGQNFEQAIASAAAQYVGNQAGAQVAKSLASFGTDVQKIMSATSTAVTKAALLNQDVEQAGLAAFVTTSIPLAVDGALKSANLTLSSNVKKTISDAAIQAALLPNANIDEILRSAAIGGLTRAVSDKVSNDSIASKVIKSDDKAAMDKIFAYVGQYFSGRSVDEIVNSSIVNDALRAADLDIKDYSATMKGWANWDQMQTAQRLFGSDVTPEFYDARVVSREKIIPILQQEGVPESDWQNIIDFYEGTVGENSTAAQVLGDIRNFVNPLYMTGAEREYVTRAFAGLEEFDQEKYQALYDQALDLAKRNQYGAVEEIVNWVNQNYTSTNEAINLWKEAFKFVGVDDYQPTQQQIDMIKGRNQIAAYTIAQHIAGERSVTFDATQFSNPKEAEEAARKANFNNFEFNDGIVYKVTTPVNEALIRDEIAKQPTYADALGKARAELGPGKTFMYGGIQYTTNIAPTGVYDASMSSDVGQSALLAYSNNKMTFLARDGKIYTIPESAKAALEAASNTSPAEAKRILEQSLNLYPDQTLNETARLLEAPGKEKMDYLSAATAGALGTSLSGLAQFLEEGAKSYALLTGDYSFDNAGVRLAGELEEYAKSKDPFGMDLQMYRFSVAMTEVANEKDPIKQTKMFAEAVNNNKLAFMKIAGSEAVAELPYIAAFVGASLALAPLGAGAVLIGGGVITATSVLMETTGTAAENAYNASKAQGDSEEVARDKALLNAGSAWLIETGTDFIANKFLLGSVGTDGVKSITKALGVGASNAGIGGVTNLAQGFSQSLAEQLIVNPNNVSVNKAYADGMLELAIGGTSQGVLGIAGYALMPNTVIGKDYSGGNVTLNDILLHDKVLDSSTVDPNVVVGRTGNNNSFTLGGMFTNMPTYNFNTQIQQTYLPQIYNNPEMVVGFDALGNNVTYGQILSRTNDQTSYEQAFNTVVNPTFEQKNQIQKDFLTDQFQNIGFTPKEEDINSLIVDNPGGNQALINAAKTVSFREIAAQENYQLSDAVLANLLKPGSGINTADQFKAYVDPQAVTAEEARNFLSAQGYTKPTEDQLSQLMNLNEEQAGAKAIEIADPYFFSAEEIKAAAAAEGFSITDEQARNLAREVESQEQAAAAYRMEIDPQATLEDEARQFFQSFGYVPTSEELAQFVLSKPEAEVQGLIGQYVDPRQVTREEVAELFRNLGYTPTEEEFAPYTQQGKDVNQAEIESSLSAYVDPRMVSEQEARDAYALLGLKKPTQADIQKLVGQYAESELAGRAQANLAEARINSIFDQLNNLSVGATPEVMDAVNKVRSDLLSQLESMGVDVSNLSQQISGVSGEVAKIKTDLVAEIQNARDAGLQGDAALQQAIDAVANQVGTSREDLLIKLGSTETGLRQEFASQIGGLETQIGNVESRLTEAINAARQDGLTGDAALQSAIDAVAASLGTTKDDVLAQLNTTETALKQSFADQLGGVQQQVTDVETRLAAAIAAAREDGLTGDAALQAAINSVSAELGTTKADLLTSLGTTEAALRQDFATQLGGVQQQVTDVEARLAQAIEAAKQAGLTGDAALQQAINDVTASLGTTKADLLAQLGTTESALREELGAGLAGVSAELQAAYDALTAEQKALADSVLAQGKTLTEALAAVESGLSGQITDVEERLQKAISDNEAAGLTRDEALQAALDSVSGELGTTRADLLAQLGTTESALRQEFATGIAGVSADLQTKYDALTAEQKALADALTQQGVDLNTAITQAQEQTTQQITDVETRLTDAIVAAEAAGLSRDQAIQAAVDSVASDLGTTRADLLAQLGTTEAALREEFGAGLAGVSAEVQAAYDSLSAEQKALADALVDQGATLTDAIDTAKDELSGQITDVETRLTDAIKVAEDAGLTRDQAIQVAIDSVAADLGTTKEGLLTQLGTTEEALRAELASGLAGVSAELQAAYNALSAEQKALADSQREQGATLAEAIATAQAQTAQQITDVESRFTSALAAAEAAGMSRDEALQQALTDVAADLGTTRSDLLSRLGTTEDALRAEFGTGLAGVSAEVKAAYDALSAEQKSLTDTLVAQGATLTEAIQSVQASLSGQISGLSADLQAKYDTLTAGQKDIVDRLVQQGDSLTAAINTVSSELSGQIQASAAETQATLLAKMREYEQAGLSRDEAMNQAIGDVSTELGVTRNQLSTQIGRPAIQDDPTTIDVNEAQAPTGIYKIMADYDAAAAQRDLELQEQMEAEALARRIEAQERSSAAQRAQLLGKAPSLLQQGMAGILPFLGAAAVASDEGAKFKSPFITSKTGQEEFGGTLEEFQKRVAQTDYTSPEFGDAQMQEFMGMPQNTEQGESMPNYFTYGEQSDIDRMFNPFASAAASFNPFQPMLAAKGGLAVLMANGGYAGGGLPVVHHSGKQRLDFREGAAVSGPGDGQSDDIPAMLADGEFVFPADVVAALGNGSTKAGSEKLYDMMHSIRAYHRSAKPQDLPPPAKASPLDYLKKSRR